MITTHFGNIASLKDLTFVPAHFYVQPVITTSLIYNQVLLLCYSCIFELNNIANGHLGSLMKSV